MIAVRAARAADREALDALVAGIADMPPRVREAAHAAIHRALGASPEGSRCIVAVAQGPEGAEGAEGAEEPRAFLCFHPVPLARDAVDVEWLLTAAADEAAPLLVEHLVSALRDGHVDAASSIRFLSGHWQRGGLDAHVLDAAGMTRAGAIDSFYGRGDDLLVFTAGSRRARNDAFDPSNAAALCDAAFAYRDFALERDFLLACAARYGSRTVRRAASWGCWAGRHVCALAEKGVHGVGIDESSEALALAEETFREHYEGLTGATWVLARLDEPVSEAPVDMSYAMLSAVHRVGSAESLVRHLRSVADLLAPGGVHVIEATLPTDATPDGNTQTVWTERRGELEITSRFRILPDRRARSGAVPTTLDVRCKKHDSQEIVGAFHQEELWIVPDAAKWRALVASAGRFEVAALLGDFQIDVGFDQVGAWRMIVVLRRTEER